MTKDRYYQAKWQLQRGPLDDKKSGIELLDYLFSLLRKKPGFYDLNQRGQWRPFEGIERLVVDLLTQRTQVMALSDREGFDGEVVVMISTGKREVFPQMIARLQGEPSMEALEGIARVGKVDSFLLFPENPEEGEKSVIFLSTSSLSFGIHNGLGEPDRKSTSGWLWIKMGKEGKVAAEEIANGINGERRDE